MGSLEPRDLEIGQEEAGVFSLLALLTGHIVGHVAGALALLLGDVSDGGSADPAWPGCGETWPT